VLESLTYVALSIIPLVSLLLAVVDMDLERKRHRRADGPASTASSYYKPQPKSVPRSPLPAGSSGQPSWTGGQPHASYPGGYTGSRGSSAATAAKSGAGVNG